MSSTLTQLAESLKELPDADAVRRRHNSFARNAEGKIIALSLSGGKLQSVALGEEAAALEYLYLAGNESLKEVLFAAPLPALTHLNLSECALASIEIPAGCGALRQVYLRKNKLAKLIFRGDCPALELLDASENELAEFSLPAGFGNLKYLHLNNNQLSVARLEPGLPALNTMNFGENRFEEISLPKKSFELETLYLQKNKIADLRFLEKSSALQNVNLSNNEITDLSPVRMLIEKGVSVNWESRNGLSVKENPLINPPPEVAKQGNEAVLNFFRERDVQGTDTLYEAKLLIVGEGGAGKTSLCRRMFFPELPLPAEDESTKGIDIHRYEFPMESADGRKMFRINVWDFGGQEIYHATHQFFLTKRSLYILLDDTRKDHKSVQDEGFKYWLEVIELLGEHSPVLIFQNEKSGRSKKIDEPGIKGRFDNVKDVFRGNLDIKGSAEEIKEAVEYHVRRLPHIGESLPKKWIEIRQEIEDLAKEMPYISRQRYFEIYEKHLPFDRDKALHLSRYLHDLGIFLHFQDDEPLADTVILQNSWATEAVFKVLDDEAVKTKMGYFNVEDCLRIWADSAYADMHAKLRALMMKFELCYLLADIRPDTWLAPQLLSPSRPQVLTGWEKPGDLELRYHYDFMPKGLVNRLMVRKHRLVQRPRLSWKNGTFFERDDSQLLVQISDKGDEIILRARGAERKDLLSVISDDLETLNDSFPGLAEKVVKKIPCICKECIERTDPEFYSYKRLIQRKKDNKLTIECPASYEDVSVIALLDGFESFEGKNPKPPKTQSGKKIFFSYSKHDRAFLDELLRHLSGLRRQGRIEPWNDHDILPGEEWDEKVKTQLASADIILLLVSPDFIATDYIWDVEITAAMERHERKEAVVIPVALRSCSWSGMPFAKLNGLPEKGKVVTRTTDYPDRDEAWVKVVEGIERVMNND